MRRLMRAHGRLVGTRPWLALLAVGLVTIVACYGLTQTADDANPEAAFLPEGSEIVAAQQALATSFPQFAGLESMQVVLRGDVLSPGGAADSRDVTELMATATQIQQYLVGDGGPISPGHVLASMIAGPEGAEAVDLRALTQRELDATIADPANTSLATTLADLVARDESGSVVGGIGIVSVNDNGEPLADPHYCLGVGFPGPAGPERT